MGNKGGGYGKKMMYFYIYLPHGDTKHSNEAATHKTYTNRFYLTTEQFKNLIKCNPPNPFLAYTTGSIGQERLGFV